LSSSVHETKIYSPDIKGVYESMTTSVPPLDAKSSLISDHAISTAARPKRYHPAMVVLHWLIALLIFATALLAMGNEGERGRFRPGQGAQTGDFQQPNFQQGNPPQQGTPQGNFPREGEGAGATFAGLPIIGIHMILGVIILLLLAIRLIVRWRTQHPDWASAGNRFFDWVGTLTHIGLYLFSFLMVITGIVLAVQRGELARVFGIGTFTPGNFRRGGFSLGFFHGGVWFFLLLLVALHVGAALYHQFIVKDNLLTRMWFGKKAA
jgi:cytochrome b561